MDLGKSGPHILIFDITSECLFCLILIITLLQLCGKHVIHLALFGKCVWLFQLNYLEGQRLIYVIDDFFKAVLLYSRQCCCISGSTDLFKAVLLYVRQGCCISGGAAVFQAVRLYFRQCCCILGSAAVFQAVILYYR